MQYQFMETQGDLLSGINPEITEYVEREILPRYNRFDAAHRVEHARAVIADSIVLARNVGADVEMAYVIAAYHDTGMVDGRETHHLASGRIIMEDMNLRKWFSEEQILTMKEAVEDHRASGKGEPRSIYGKIVADADREIGNLQPLRRTIQYGMKNYPELNKEGHYRRFHSHMQEKYARGGYMHLWLEGTDKAQLLGQLQDLIEDEAMLRQTFDRLWADEVKNQKYTSAYQQIESLLDGEKDTIAKMANMVAVLDIDSERFSTFDETDKLWLEKIVKLL